MSERGIYKLRSGDFNTMAQEELSDGSKLITLRKRGDPRVYTFQVRDLYGPGEQVFNEQVTEAH